MNEPMNDSKIESQRWWNGMRACVPFLIPFSGLVAARAVCTVNLRLRMYLQMNAQSLYLKA